MVSGWVLSCFLIISGESRFLLSCWMIMIIIMVNSVLVGEFINVIIIVGAVLRNGLRYGMILVMVIIILRINV